MRRYIVGAGLMGFGGHACRRLRCWRRDHRRLGVRADGVDRVDRHVGSARRSWMLLWIALRRSRSRTASSACCPVNHVKAATLPDVVARWKYEDDSTTLNLGGALHQLRFASPNPADCCASRRRATRRFSIWKPCAAGPPPLPTAMAGPTREEQAACRSDAMKYCSSHVRKPTEMNACLKTNKANLSNA